MRTRPAHTLLAAALALTLAGLACAGGGPAATSIPTQASQPTAASAAATSTSTGSGLAATTSAPTQAATQANLSGSLDIHGVSAFLDKGGSYRVVGLLTNGTDKPVNHIKLSLQVTDAGGKSVLLDSSSQPTDAVEVQPSLGTLSPGQSTPFEYFMIVNAADTSGWKQTVQLASSQTASDLSRAQVEVANAQLTPSAGGLVFLTGELVNKSDQPATVNSFSAALVDDSGTVIGVATFPDFGHALAPAGDASGSDRAPFVARVVGKSPQGTPNYYVDAVTSDGSDFQTASAIHMKLNTSFADSANGVHVVATITNTGSTTMTALLVAGLYDQSGKVLDASSAAAPIDLAPGDSSPVFFTDFPNVGGNADLINKVVSYTAQIDPFYTVPTSHDFVALEASNVTNAVNSGIATVSGDVVNTSSKTLDRATVVVIVQDGTGKIVTGGATSANPPASGFGPNAKQSWTVDIPLPDKIDSTTLKFVTLVKGLVGG